MPGPLAAVLDPEAETELPLARLGYPKLTIMATAAGFSAPATVEAGRYLVTLKNAGGHALDAQLVLPPAGVTAGEVVATLASASTLPDWFYRAIWSGGPADASPAPNATAQAVVDLTPGTWLIVQADGDRPVAPLTLTVTGEAVTRSMGDAPHADLTVTMREHGIDFSNEMVAGAQVWEVTNAGEVPHEIVLFSYPRPVTRQQVMSVLLPEEGGAPQGMGIDPDLLAYAGYVPLLSPGVTTWVTMDLAPGNYVALSGIAEPGSAARHAEMGTGAAFTVAQRPGSAWGRR